MKINFLLKAEPSFNGVLRVIQYIHAVGGEKYTDAQGNSKFKIDMLARIDEGLIAAHKQEYDAFNKYVEQNAEVLYELAKLNAGDFIDVTAIMEAGEKTLDESPIKPEVTDAPIEEKKEAIEEEKSEEVAVKKGFGFKKRKKDL